MNDGNIFKRIASYLRKQGRIIDDNAAEVERANARLAYTMLAMGCLCYLPLLVATLLSESYRSMTAAYLAVFLLMGAYLVAFHRLKRIFSPTYLIYAGYALFTGYTVYSSAFLAPDYAGIIILLILVQLPIVILDKSWRVVLVETLLTAAYLVLVIPFKDPQLALGEILNCVLFAAFGIGIGESLRYGRLDNLELKRQALLREKTDPLTGLGNRKSFFEYLKKLESTEDSYADIGFLMIDIDFFKQFNDTYGHQQGDECLKKVGTCFREFGAADAVTFYRYGGEEFVGVAVGYAPDELLHLCRRLNTAVAGLAIPHRSAVGDVVTVSIGFATATGTSSANRQHSFLSQADLALYAAKASGRNCSVPYAEGMSMSFGAEVKPSFRTTRP